MRIWLARHGATAWSGLRYCGKADPPLTQDGRSQADDLRELLGREAESAVIWSSPARRALETAARSGSTVVVDARLSEVDFGEVEGSTFEDLAARHPEIARRVVGGETRIDWPGGEPWVDLEQRVEAVWQAIVAGSVDAVVISHAGPLRVLARLATGREIHLVPGSYLFTSR